jgi:hypothetical protein
MIETGANLLAEHLCERPLLGSPERLADGRVGSNSAGLVRVDSGQSVSDGRRSKADTHCSASLVEREVSVVGTTGQIYG